MGLLGADESGDTTGMAPPRLLACGDPTSMHIPRHSRLLTPEPCVLTQAARGSPRSRSDPHYDQSRNRSSVGDVAAPSLQKCLQVGVCLVLAGVAEQEHAGVRGEVWCASSLGAVAVLVLVVDSQARDECRSS